MSRVGRQKERQPLNTFFFCLLFLYRLSGFLFFFVFFVLTLSQLADIEVPNVICVTTALVLVVSFLAALFSI